MLKLFKTPLATVPFVIIFVFMISTRLAMYFYAYDTDIWQFPMSPFSLGLKTAFGSLFSQLAFQLTASFVLVFIQINIISVLTAKLKNTMWREFISPWLFVLCMSAHPAFLLLSPQLISFTFILLSVSTLLKLGEKSEAIKNILSTSIFIGIAAGFWLPSLFFIAMILYYLFKINKFKLRNLLAIVVGFSIPFIYVFSFAYLFSVENVFYNNIVFNQFFIENKNYKNYLSLIAISILGLLSFLSLSRYLNGQLKETKEFFYLIYIYCFLLVFSFIFNFHNNINIWVFVFFPVSLSLNIFFNSFKRFFIAEIIHVVLFLIILVNFIHLLN